MINAAKVAKEYEAKGGDYENEEGSKNKAEKGPPQHKADDDDKKKKSPAKSKAAAKPKETKAKETKASKAKAAKEVITPLTLTCKIVRYQSWQKPVLLTMRCQSINGRVVRCHVMFSPAVNISAGTGCVMLVIQFSSCYSNKL